MDSKESSPFIGGPRESHLSDGLNEEITRQLRTMRRDDLETSSFLPHPDSSAGRYTNNYSAVRDDNESSNEYNYYKISLWCIFAQTFLSTFCSGILVPSLYYCVTEQHNEDDIFYGWTVASFGLICFFFSPIFTIWAMAQPSAFKEIMAISTAGSLAGCVIYALADSKWLIMAGRGLTGLTMVSGVLGRVYIGLIPISTEEKQISLAKQMISSSFGYLLGPAIASILDPLKHHPLTYKDFTLDAYSSPAYLTGVLFFVYFVAMLLCFRTPKDAVPTPQASKPLGSLNRRKHNIFRRHYATAAVCLLGMIVFGFDQIVFETVMVPFTSERYDWGIWQNGLLLFGLGFMNVIALQVAKILSDKTNERVVFLLAQAVLLLSVGLFLGWNGFRTSQDGEVALWRFIIGSIVFHFANSAAWFQIHPIFVNSLSLSHQEAFKNVVSMGLLVGRSVGPLAVGYTLQYEGTNLTWLCVAAVNASYFVLCGALWKFYQPTVQFLRTSEYNVN